MAVSTGAASAGPAGPFGGALLRGRHWVLLAWGLLFAAVVLHGQKGDGGDSLFFSEGYNLLVHGYVNVPHKYITVHMTGGGLHLYANHPVIQIGPLALVLYGAVIWLDHLSRFIAPILFVPLGVLAIRWLERLVLGLWPQREREVQQLTLLAGLFVMFAWVQALVQFCHIDDMLVVVGTLGALTAIAQRKPWMLGIAVGLAVAAKPTALVLLPLVFALTWRQNVKAAAVSVALIGACWLPFVLADPSTLHAGVAQFPVRPGSGLTLLGYAAGSNPPGPIREIQLFVALLAGAIAVGRGRWYLVPLVGFGLRTALDPSVVSYYAVSVILGAMVADTFAARRLPVLTMVTWLALSEPLTSVIFWPVPSPTTQAWLRLGVPVLVTVVALVRTDRTMSSAAALQPGLARPCEAPLLFAATG